MASSTYAAHADIRRPTLPMSRVRCAHSHPRRHEDSISQALRSGKVDVDTASDFLCWTTAKQCDEPLATEKEQASAADEAATAAEREQQQPDAATAASESAGSVKQEGRVEL